MTTLPKLLISIIALMGIGYIASTSLLLWNRIQKSKHIITNTQSFTSQGTNPTILITGDSTAVGVGASENKDSIAGRIHQDIPNATIKNIGVSGLRTNQLIPLLQNIPNQTNYDLIILQIGGNDIVRFTNLNELSQDIHQAITLAQQHSQSVILMTSGNVGAAPLFPLPLRHIYHSRTLQVRRLFQEAANTKNITYIDLYRPPQEDPFLQDISTYFASDYFHPSGAGYGIWYQRLQPVIEKMFPPHNSTS